MWTTTEARTCGRAAGRLTVKNSLRYRSGQAISHGSIDTRSERPARKRVSNDTRAQSASSTRRRRLSLSLERGGSEEEGEGESEKGTTKRSQRRRRRCVARSKTEKRKAAAEAGFARATTSRKRRLILAHFPRAAPVSSFLFLNLRASRSLRVASALLGAGPFCRCAQSRLAGGSGTRCVPQWRTPRVMIYGMRTLEKRVP